MLTFNGHLYTCGAKENGKLGHGSQGSSGNLGRITRVTKFLDSDEQTDMDVRIGYVSTQFFFATSKTATVYTYTDLLCLHGMNSAVVETQ